MPSDLRNDLIDVLESVTRAQLKTLRRLRSSSLPESSPSGIKTLKGMSQIDMVYNILRSAGRSLHISEIMTLVTKQYGATLDRESIVSAITKRVARKDRFIRTGPNQFSVLPDIER
jgi:hypothetical protein